MTTPTPHELAAAREIMDMLIVNATKPYQYVDADKLTTIIAKHRSEEVKELQQVARHNADWFDSLVNDLSEIVECDKRPSDVISKVIELQRKAKALDWWQAQWPSIGLGVQTDQSWSWLDRKSGRVSTGHKSLLEAIEAAAKEN